MITRLIILSLIFFGCTADDQDDVIRVTKNTSGVIENSNNSVNSDSDSNQINESNNSVNSDLESNQQNESNNSSNSNDSNNQESINTQSNLNSSKIYFENDTCKCPEASVGDKTEINGVVYTVVDDKTISEEIYPKIIGAGAVLNTNLCTTLVKSMSELFKSTTEIPNISFWDTSNVLDMREMFQWAVRFNQDIGNWNVSNVINMSRMFSDATKFNGDISSWDTSNVTDMSRMFHDAISFNQNISNWDVSKVTNMEHMFSGDYRSNIFNQDIGNWDVSSVTNMRYMFEYSYFNQDIGRWNVINVKSMYSMFHRNNIFNQDISNWCVSEIQSQGRFNSYPLSLNSNAAHRPLWGTCPSGNIVDNQNEIQTISSEQIDFSFYEIQFLNENLGFAAAGSKLMKTNDGGDSWAEIYNSKHISEVLFLNELIGFINSNDKLLKTSNGGISFIEIHDFNRSITDIHMYNGTLIISGTNLWNTKIYNYDEMDGESMTGLVNYSKIITSNDEGESFKSYDFRESSIANSNGVGISDSHGHFSILVKDNILFMDMGGSAHNYVVRFDLSKNDLEDFVYNDNRQLFLESGVIVQTPSIRIKTYSVIGNKVYAFGHDYRRCCGSFNDSFNVPHNGFILSNDNGRNWTYKSFGKYDDITFFSSYFSHSNIGYIVGESGHFLKTTDGGENWTKIDLGTYKNIYDIEKINDQELILVGEDGFIHKYNIGN